VFSRSVAFLARTAAAVALTIVASASAAADELASVPRRDPALERALDDAMQPYGGWTVQIDNDLFAGTQKDRDYTGGLALGVSGPGIANQWWSLDPLLSRLDRFAPGSGRASGNAVVQYSAQFGLLGFTPQDIANQAIDAGDRPYASLLYMTSGRQYIDAGERRVRNTALTVGVLGLSLTSDIHDAIHDVVGSDSPRGYDQQISAGGEPTLRYVVSDSKLRTQRLAFGSGLIEAKTTAEMSVGYLTEASYAVSTRFGQIDSPWWSFNPERIDYIAQPSVVPHRRGGGSEFYFWAGAKVRVRAYNAFLQGQFRDSAHSFAADEVEHVIGEAWVGLTGELGNGTTMSYSVRYQTAELRDGIGRRDPVWAGVTITHSFM
jgi:hypothetical protein